MENYFLDTTGDGYYDTIVTSSGGYIRTRSGDVTTNQQKINSTNAEAINNQIKAVAHSLNAHSTASATEGGGFGVATSSQAGAEQMLESEQTIGEAQVGMKGLSASDIQEKTPRELAEHILATQYAGKIPTEYAGDKERFLTFLVQQMPAMPGKGEISEEEMGFLGEEKELAGRRTDLAWDATKYGLQGQAGQIGGMLRGGYEGGGVGMRGAIGAGKTIAQGFETGLETRDIGMDVADLGYRKSVYGLEQGLEADYLQNFQKFLGSLPEAA